MSIYKGSKVKCTTHKVVTYNTQENWKHFAAHTPTPSYSHSSTDRERVDLSSHLLMTKNVCKYECAKSVYLTKHQRKQQSVFLIAPYMALVLGRRSSVQFGEGTAVAKDLLHLSSKRRQGS